MVWYTDNPTLSENCNESDFFSPVDFDLNFMLTSRQCVEYIAEDIIPQCRLPTYKIETNSRVFHFYRKNTEPIVTQPANGSQVHHGYYEVGYVGNLPIKEQADDDDLNLQDLINAIIQDYNYHISNSSTSIFATWQENSTPTSTPLGSSDFNTNAQASGFDTFKLGGYPNENLINFINGYELSFDTLMPSWHNQNDFIKDPDDSVYKSDYDGGAPGYEGGHYLSGTCRSCDPTQMTNVNTNSVLTLSNIFDIN